MKQIKLPKTYNEYMLDYKKEIAKLYEHFGSVEIAKMLSIGSAGTVLKWLRDVDTPIRITGTHVNNTDKLELIQVSEPAILWKESIKPLAVGQYIRIDRPLKNWHRAKAHLAAKKCGYKVCIVVMDEGFLIQRVS